MYACEPVVYLWAVGGFRTQVAGSSLSSSLSSPSVLFQVPKQSVSFLLGVGTQVNY